MAAGPRRWCGAADVLRATVRSAGDAEVAGYRRDLGARGCDASPVVAQDRAAGELSVGALPRPTGSRPRSACSPASRAGPDRHRLCDLARGAARAPGGRADAHPRRGRCGARSARSRCAARARRRARARCCRSCSPAPPRDEQDFLVRLLVGELRQGALEGVMIEAIAARRGAAGRPTCGAPRCSPASSAPVAQAALAEGRGRPRALRARSCSGRSSRCSRSRRTTSPRRSRTLGARGARIQARRRAHAGAQGGRRGARLHAQPATTSPPPCPRSSRRCARCRRAS